MMRVAHVTNFDSIETLELRSNRKRKVVDKSDSVILHRILSRGTFSVNGEDRLESLIDLLSRGMECVIVT